MTALEAFLRETIASEGPMSVERFMGLALGHPRYGYYMTRDPFGVAGDFITSPEISQTFGELIGLWAVDAWMRMGKPSVLRVVELGPGRGALMSDFLRAARVAPGFLDAVDLFLVETSPVLADRQRATLAQAPIQPTWTARLQDVPPGPAIVVANEFFDALPIRQYARAQDGWRERLVGLDERGELTFALSPHIELSLTAQAPVGAIVDVGVVALVEARALARRLVADGGYALIVDYGAARGEGSDTLQALRRGAPVDPLSDPGEADLTAHVNFAALKATAEDNGAAIDGPVEQGIFLQRLGIVERAERLMRSAREEARAPIAGGVGRLIDRSTPSSMGALFKAMCIRSPACPAPAGLETFT